MKKILFSLLVGGALGGFITSGHAATYRDTDSFGPLGTKVNAGNTLVGYLQIDANDVDGIADVTGYNSAVEQINSATASFLLGDDLDFASETVNILLGASVFVSGGGVPSIIGWVSGAVTGTALFDLQSDGVLKYTISANTGDFMAYTASIRAQSGPRSVGVPDNGTFMALFGMSLTGLAFVGRKFRV